MHPDFKPGQVLTCTITGTPRTVDAQQTIARLMRQDPVVRRGLRVGQRRRRQTTVHSPRGGRLWARRQKCAKIVTVGRGETWTMRWSPHLKPDLAAVAPFVSISAA
jgi:hypothetical protein